MESGPPVVWPAAPTFAGRNDSFLPRARRKQIRRYRGLVHHKTTITPHGKVSGACFSASDIPKARRAHTKSTRNIIINIVIIKLTSVPPLALGLVPEGDAGAAVHDGGLLLDEPVGEELVDVPAAVGQGDLVDLVGVHPDLALSALEDVRREALLQFERNWTKNRERERKSGVDAFGEKKN